jgi:hypothetical protein
MSSRTPDSARTVVKALTGLKQGHSSDDSTPDSTPLPRSSTAVSKTIHSTQSFLKERENQEILKDEESFHTEEEKEVPCYVITNENLLKQWWTLLINLILIYMVSGLMRSDFGVDGWMGGWVSE